MLILIHTIISKNIFQVMILISHQSPASISIKDVLLILILLLHVYSCDNPFKKKTSISEIISPDTSEYNYYICAL